MVLSKLRLLPSARLDSQSLLCVVLSRDARFLDKLRREVRSPTSRTPNRSKIAFWRVKSGAEAPKTGLPKSCHPDCRATGACPTSALIPHRVWHAQRRRQTSVTPSKLGR
jgi:hypothetical protein